MIGQRYDSETWNCVHEVMQWYEQHGCPDVLKPSEMSEWGVRFVLWMRRHFIPINALEQGALVVMRNKYTGGLHVGVWDKGMVHHCYQPLTGGLGQAIRSPLCLVKSAHVIIKYGRYNGAHSLL